MQVSEFDEREYVEEEHRPCGAPEGVVVDFSATRWPGARSTQPTSYGRWTRGGTITFFTSSAVTVRVTEHGV